MGFHFSKQLIFLRLKSGKCFIVKRTPPLFSERNGYVKSYRLGFGWRLVIIS